MAAAGPWVMGLLAPTLIALGCTSAGPAAPRDGGGVSPGAACFTAAVAVDLATGASPEEVDLAVGGRPQEWRETPETGWRVVSAHEWPSWAAAAAASWLLRIEWAGEGSADRELDVLLSCAANCAEPQLQRCQQYYRVSSSPPQDSGSSGLWLEAGECFYGGGGHTIWTL